MRHAFTLIELLVVIAILAVLAVVVVLTLNPAGLLQEARDSNRISDMATIKSAVGIWQADGGTSLGSAGSVYVSIPDPAATSTSGTNCAAVGLAASTSSVPYHCAESATTTWRMTNGMGWIPVNFAAMSAGSPFALLPVDPVNSTSSNLYYTYLTDGAGNWKAFTQMESAKYLATAQADGGTLPSSLETGSSLTIADYAFPSGWVQVPGNGTFGKSTFWVMQYDAKCANAATNQPLTYPDTGYQTYSDSTGGAACTSANGNYIASAQSGYPEANVTPATAASYCASIGAHLITNNEWQTIAWNAENVASNWSSGTVGTGNVSRGNTDSSWAQSDSNPEGLALTTSTHQTDFTHLRTLTLSNGSVIWDLSGNVWEWTNDTITGTNEPHGAATGFSWNEFTAVTGWGSMTQSTAGPANAAWNSSNGMGKLYSEGQSDSQVYGFLRGGSWSDVGVAGVEALRLDNTPGYTYYYTIGFRCAR